VTICVVGGLIILLDLTLPPRVGLGLEFAVGIVLTVVGTLNLTGRGGFLLADEHHAHGADHAHVASAEEGMSQRLRAFLVGLVHGLAGSAAVALLVLATVRDPWLGCVYLLVFGAGTIVGMMLVTVAFASPVALLARRFRWSGERLRVITGILSVAFGLYVMYQVGVVDGLFLAVPRWDPH
jgi:high-affinity nickel-transport protein